VWAEAIPNKQEIASEQTALLAMTIPTGAQEINMRFGCCANMVATGPDGIGLEITEQLAELSYDYIELSLAHMMALPDAEFSALARRVTRSGIRCEACNNFYPRTVRLTGDTVDWQQVQDYTARAIARAAELGAQTIVFGSSGAKNVPEGFPMARAWEQIVETLRMVDPLAASHGITIAIEPLNRRESNIVLTAREGLALVRQVDRPRIKLLVDYYHMTLEDESPDILLEAGLDVRHIHFARVEGRSFPAEVETGNHPFFANLQKIGYDGHVSVEAYSSDFAADAARALAVMKEAAGR